MLTFSKVKGDGDTVALRRVEGRADTRHTRSVFPALHCTQPCAWHGPMCPRCGCNAPHNANGPTHTHTKTHKSAECGAVQAHVRDMSGLRAMALNMSWEERPAAAAAAVYVAENSIFWGQSEAGGSVPVYQA